MLVIDSAGVRWDWVPAGILGVPVLMSFETCETRPVLTSYFIVTEITDVKDPESVY